MMELVKEARMKKAVVSSTGHVREGGLSHVANDPKVGSMTVGIGAKEFVAENPGLRACECPAGQLHALFDLIPDITLDDLARFLIDYHRQMNLRIWRRKLQAAHEALPPVSSPTGLDLVTHWNRILDEFTSFKYAQKVGHPIPGTRVERFNIASLYTALVPLGSDSKSELAVRLVDVKMNLTFLWNIMHSQYQGIFQVPGDNKLESITPEAVAWLYGLSQKIFYLSVLTEKTLDLVEYIATGTCTKRKKDKWGKKLQVLANYLSVGEGDCKLMLAFRDRYRTAEFHELSSVRAMTAKDKWNNFDAEQEQIMKILEQLSVKLTQTPEPHRMRGAGSG